MSNKANIVCAIHNLRLADEHFADYLRERPGHFNQQIFGKYRERIKWMLNDIITIRVLSEPVRQAIKKELECDVLAVPEIHDKLALLPDEQRLEVEKLIDELIIIHKAHKTNYSHA